MGIGDDVEQEPGRVPGTPAEARERWNIFDELAEPALRILSTIAVAVLNSLTAVKSADWDAYGPYNKYALPEKLWRDYLSKPSALRILKLKIQSPRFRKNAAEFCAAYDFLFPRLIELAPTEDVEQNLQSSVFGKIAAGLRPLLSQEQGRPINYDFDRIG